MRAHLLTIALVISIVQAAGVYAKPDYPNKPVRLIVPFAPGGGTDIIARLLAQQLAESFKQPVIVDNRGGGGGRIGIETAVKATPDGHTMILLTAGYATNAALQKLSHDPATDVTPIGLVGETAFIVALNPSFAVRTMKELIAHEKTKPGSIQYGSAGAGGITHLASELINHMGGTGMKHVPYKGAGPALSDLLGGRIQLVLGGGPSTLPHVRAGRLRAVAVTTAKRSSAAPDIPTVGETIAGYEAPLWFAVLGPKALPKDVIGRWGNEIDRALQSPEMKKRMSSDGVTPLGGPAERFREVLQRDIGKWRKVVQAAGIRVGD